MRSTLAALLLLSAGCGSRTILVPDSAPKRLAEPADVRIYVRDPATGQWTAGANKVRIPQGWYVLPPPTTQP